MKQIFRQNYAVFTSKFIAEQKQQSALAEFAGSALAALALETT